MSKVLVSVLTILFVFSLTTPRFSMITRELAVKNGGKADGLSIETAASFRPLFTLLHVHLDFVKRQDGLLFTLGRRAKLQAPVPHFIVNGLLALGKR